MRSTCWYDDTSGLGGRQGQERQLLASFSLPASVLTFEFLFESVPDCVTGFVGGFEETFGVFRDTFEVADKSGTDGVVSEEGLETRIGADVAVTVGEEFGEIF